MPDATTPFDRALGRRRLLRARSGGEAYPAFLLERAAEDLRERLAAVTRRFRAGVDLGTPTDVARPAMEEGCEVVFRLGPPGAGELSAIADEEALPLAEGSIGLVVSLLALQGVNDLPGCLAQVRRSLEPDGLFLACLLGGDSLTELRQSFAAAEAEKEGGLSPRVAPFADVRAMGGLLQRAGFALPVVDVDRVTVRYRSPFGLFADLRAMGWSNALTERRRSPLRRGTLMRAVELYAERFSDPDGRVRATFDLVWLSGWAPHESQQKPLRPGSAKARLADALGVPERGFDKP